MGQRQILIRGIEQIVWRTVHLALLCLTAVHADVYTVWTTAQGTNHTNEFNNPTGAYNPGDLSYANDTKGGQTYSGFFAGGNSGSITEMLLLTDIYVSAALTDDYTTFTPEVSGTATGTHNISTITWNNHQGSGKLGREQLDVTADRAWTFADLANLEVYAQIAITKNSDNRTFYFDAVGFQITYTVDFPVVSIDSAKQVTTDGSGGVRVYYDLTDVDLDVCSLAVQYSYDNASWFYADIQSASTGTPGTGYVRNIATPAADKNFLWNTKSVSNGDGAFNGEDNTVWVRLEPWDPGQAGPIDTSASFAVDNLSPRGMGSYTPTDSTDWPGPRPTLTCSLGTDASTISYYIDVDTIGNAFTGTHYQSSGWQLNDNNWTPAPLIVGGWYWWRTKGMDAYGNEGAFAADSFIFQVSPYRPNLVIDSAKQTSTDASGLVTLYFDVTDPTHDPCSLAVQYSFNNSAWKMAHITSASTGTVSAAGVNDSTTRAQVFQLATDVTDAWLVWDTRNANNQGGAFGGEDSTVWLRGIPRDSSADSGFDGEMVASLYFTVDNQAPTGGGCAVPADGATEIGVGTRLRCFKGSDVSVISYDFSVDTSSNFSTALESSGWQTDTSWLPSVLFGDKTHYYRVRMKDAYGNTGAYIDTFDFTTTDGWTYPADATTIDPVSHMALGDGIVYIGTAGTTPTVYALSTIDGTEKWQYTTASSVSGLSCEYIGGKYHVYVSVNRYIHAVQDNGTSRSLAWVVDPRDLGKVKGSYYDPSAVTPDPGQNNLYFAYASQQWKISSADGTDAAGWTKTDNGYSQLSTPVVDASYIYYATTGGAVYKINVADGTSPSSASCGANAINTPLGMWNGMMYATPNDNNVYGFDVSTMGVTTSWSLNVGANTGSGVYSSGEGILYTAAGSNLVKITDNGAPSGVDWTYSSPTLAIRTTPVATIDGTKIYFASDDNNAYAVTSGGGVVTGFPRAGPTAAISATPVLDLDNSIVVYGSEEGKVYGYPLQ